MRKYRLAALWLGLTLGALPAAAQEKVILDSDYTTIGDDGQVGVMAMQLHAQGAINLLGITVVAGNNWLPQEVSDALKAVERIGLADTVGVYAGARGLCSRTQRRPPTFTTRSRWRISSIRHMRPKSSKCGSMSIRTGDRATDTRSGIATHKSQLPITCRNTRSSCASTTSGSSNCMWIC